jgi:hypothetical protein
MPFNDSTAASIKNASKACGFDEFTDKYLTFPPPGQQPDVCQQPGINENCTDYLPGCDVFSTAYNAIYEINPGFNICMWNPPYAPNSNVLDLKLLGGHQSPPIRSVRS